MVRVPDIFSTDKIRGGFEVRHGRPIPAHVLLLALMIGLAAHATIAQRLGGPGSRAGVRLVSQQERPAPGPPPRNAFRPNVNAGAGRSQPNLRGMAALPPKWVDNLRDMSPEEQQRFLRNNDRFESLPAQRQAQIRKNLEDWNRLSPTERGAIRDRERILERMTPRQRQYVRNVLLPQWQALTPQRRQMINGRLHTLQGMNPADQQAALDDPRFMRGLDPDEQALLRNLNSLRNPAP
jgi:hypothetical protein